VTEPRRKRGRPPLPESERATRHYQVRLTEAEADSVDALALAAEMPPTTWIADTVRARLRRHR